MTKKRIIEKLNNKLEKNTVLEIPKKLIKNKEVGKVFWDNIDDKLKMKLLMFKASDAIFNIDSLTMTFYDFFNNENQAVLNGIKKFLNENENFKKQIITKFLAYNRTRNSVRILKNLEIDFSYKKLINMFYESETEYETFVDFLIYLQDISKTTVETNEMFKQFYNDVKNINEREKRMLLKALFRKYARNLLKDKVLETYNWFTNFFEIENDIEKNIDFLDLPIILTITKNEDIVLKKLEIYLKEIEKIPSFEIYEILNCILKMKISKNQILKDLVLKWCTKNGDFVLSQYIDFFFEIEQKKII